MAIEAPKKHSEMLTFLIECTIVNTNGWAKQGVHLFINKGLFLLRGQKKWFAQDFSYLPVNDEKYLFDRLCKKRLWEMCRLQDTPHLSEYPLKKQELFK